MNSTAAIILAAGSSNRLGQPKQLLAFRGKTLLETMIDTAKSSACSEVFVVLGAHADRIINTVGHLPVATVRNKHWEEGMSSSIRTGLSALLQKSPLPFDILFMVCDQPHVTSSLLNDLISKKHSAAAKIVASAYRDTMGIPVVFDKSLIPELMQLKGQEGAKKIIIKHLSETETIPFPMGYIDIDTMDDYEELNKR